MQMLEDRKRKKETPKNESYAKANSYKKNEISIREYRFFLQKLLTYVTHLYKLGDKSEK